VKSAASSWLRAGPPFPHARMASALRPCVKPVLLNASDSLSGCRSLWANSPLGKGIVRP
jgi:hypothetical protein